VRVNAQHLAATALVMQQGSIRITEGKACATFILWSV